ncbi:MAG: hypothetical protein Q4B54_08095 [Coriobacteriales bacterium]|nr:hypothetical protein [Coriobacteriales bacterium]
MDESLARARDRLLASLCERGFVRGTTSRWGRDVLDFDHVGQAQELMAATARQRRLIACAHGTPCPGDDLCASWVEQTFSRMGYGVVLGDAAALYNSYCHYTGLDELKVGMIVATSAHPYTPAGLKHGHVGLYAGDDKIMDCAAGAVRTVPLELWLITYGLIGEPRWGWLGSIGLS